MNCQKCNSNRMMSVHAHAKDSHIVQFEDTEYDGYLPDDLGIGGGDDLNIDYCLDCGTIAGTWPLPETGMECGFPNKSSDEEDEDMIDLPATGVLVACADDKEVFRFDKDKMSDVAYFERGKLQVIKIDEVSSYRARGFYIDKGIKQ